MAAPLPLMAAPLPPLVLTGATGFVGRHLLAALRDAHSSAATPARAVTLLLRDPAALSQQARPAEWQTVRCDLARGPVPVGAIPTGSVVVHLAAATGRLSPAVMREVNVEGTRRLVAASVAAGASHLIFVSSVAAGFADRRWYHYAEAKREAEAIVANSGLAYTIVRPTMVFGTGSPVQKGLESLALGGAPIVLGTGEVQVQPIHVDDLAQLLLALAAQPPSLSETIDAGGARSLSMRALLGQIRQAHGRPARRTWSVPLALPRTLLALAERVVGSRLPVTAGQLASFVNDSTARVHPHVDARIPVRRTLGDMLDHGGAPLALRDDDFAATPRRRVTSDDELVREFSTLAAYLGAPDAGARAAASYARAHASVGDDGDAFDRRLVTLARGSSAACALADAYARLARPYGTLRRKLTLALAVLESSPGVHRRYDTAHESSTLAAWAGIVGAGLLWAARTVASVILLAPLQLAARLGPERERRAAQHG